MKIGFFSTDFNSQPVPDEEKTRIYGTPHFIPGQQMVSHGGTFWYRGGMQAMELAKHGYDVVVSWQMRIAPAGHIELMDRFGEWHSDIDLIYTQRYMARGADEQMRRARSTGQRTLADLDDDFWALGKTNLAYHTTDPARAPDFNRQHYWDMLGACDAITVSTEALRKRVDRLGVPTFVLRNAIDIERWPQKDPGADGMISWIGGIQWRSHDLPQLRQYLPSFLELHGLPMYHGGHSRVEGVPTFFEQIGIDPTKVQCTVADLCRIDQYPQLWNPVNISLIPLEKVAFNQAKSWLKSLESSACGVPYIVSKGFYEQQLLIDEGTAGRSARNDKPITWVEHLEDLLDPEVRRKEGAINRMVAERHDIRSRWVEWDAAYRQVMAL